MRVFVSIVICAILTEFSLYSHNIGCSIGFNMLGIGRGIAGIQAGYAFSANWSFSSTIDISYSRLHVEKNKIQAIHENEFPDNTITVDKPMDFCTESFSLRYWPEGTSGGVFLSTGLKHGNRNGFDYTLGIGYAMQIWKGLYIIVGYESLVKKVLSSGKLPGEGLMLNLCYNF